MWTGMRNAEEPFVDVSRPIQRINFVTLMILMMKARNGMETETQRSEVWPADIPRETNTFNTYNTFKLRKISLSILRLRLKRRKLTIS